VVLVLVITIALITGLGAGLLKDGEVGISATNRNYKGRMGSPLASTYLASPAVVAASAISGYISAPESWDVINNMDGIKANIIKTASNRIKTKTGDSNVYDGFQSALSGEIVFCDQDNLNTDGIYPGKYTYEDDIAPEKMAKVVMENYDREFSSIIQKNDILVTGFNFGTGSSREQAATALKYAGVKLILAGSFSETFKRNAINNGLLVLECAALVSDLRKKRINLPKSLTWRSGLPATADLLSGEIIVDSKKYDIPSVGYSAQELLVEGGLESWISKTLSAQ
jgi:homoaconitate hydratase